MARGLNDSLTLCHSGLTSGILTTKTVTERRREGGGILEEWWGEVSGTERLASRVTRDRERVEARKEGMPWGCIFLFFTLSFLSGVRTWGL